MSEFRVLVLCFLSFVSAVVTADPLFTRSLSLNEERSFLDDAQINNLAAKRAHKRTNAAVVVNINRGALLADSIDIPSLDGQTRTFFKANDTGTNKEGVFLFHGVSRRGGEAHIAIGPDGDVLGTIQENGAFLVLQSLGQKSDFQTLMNVSQGLKPEVAK